MTLRLARRSPIVVFVIVLTLGLGVGANVSVLAVLEAVLLRPLPYDQPDELVLVLGALPEQGRLYEMVSFETYRDWQRRSRVFSDLAAVSLPRSFILSGIDVPSSVRSELASTNYFGLLGLEPILGRAFTAEEELGPTPEPPVVLSYALWQALLGGTHEISDRTVRINDVDFRVVGVMGPAFRGLQWDPVDLWLPLGVAEQLLGPTYRDRSRRWLTTLARLDEGVSLTQAREGMKQVTTALEEEYPVLYKDRAAALHPLASYYYGPELRQGLRFLLLASLFVLTLCATNVGALLMVQALARRREIAIRATLGAGTGRLVRQFTVQSILYSLIGGAFAVGLARSLTPHLVALSDVRPATFDDHYVGRTVLLISLGLALLLGAILGALPPLALSRLRLTEALKEGARSGTASPWGRRLRSTFVTLQLALGFVLLASATLLMRSLRDLTSGDVGFDTRNLLTLQIDLPTLRYPGEEAFRFAERLAGGVGQLAGVKGVTVSGPQLAPRALHTIEATTPEQLADGDDAGKVTLNLHSVLPGFFDVLDIPLLQGRAFTLLDDRDHPPVVVISQSVAELLWPHGEALGRRLRLDPSPWDAIDVWYTVVGVVADVRHRGFTSAQKLDQDIYLCLHQNPLRSFFLLARTTVDPESLNGRIRAAGLEIDPDLPLDRFGTVRQRFALAGADTRFHTVLVSIFAGLALLLAAIGLYGVLAVTLREQRRELAVRIALGASRRALSHLVLSQSVRLLLPGLLLGLLGCLLVKPLLAASLHGVSPTDPSTLLLDAAVLSMVAFGAAILPTRRATRVDPATVLRSE